VSEPLDPALARRIRLVGLDVDGVLTDGGVYVGHAGDQPIELKRFQIQDGLGLRLLAAAGIRIVLVSGRPSEATTVRARELHVHEVIQDEGARKLPAFTGLLERQGIAWADCCFVGDDLPDLPLLRRVGLPVAVANAVPEVRDVARFVTTRPGGSGAVREVAEAILRARDAWDALLTDYLRQRGEADAAVGSG
jgi:3-deoxy-D-manno-octulosonate 8-phosphate phosphatase (KDO 8-P phosphatase)